MKLKQFKQIEGYNFFLTFDDGLQKEVNLEPLLKEKIQPKDLESAFIDKDWGCLEFKNGMVDIEPKTLYKYVISSKSRGQYFQ
jgi:hypothetical protein